jgi:uncharacterized protein YbjT (DUF2867 family)
MKHILITGATGNVGIEIIKHLYTQETQHKIIAGVRNISKAKEVFKNYPSLNYSEFDFENPSTFVNSLKNISTIFLLRPPHISKINKIFKPLMNAIKSNSINEIVFLSVQGAEKSNVIPHNKIEKLIQEYNLDYIFIRPSYFMQNLTTTLLSDIKSKRKIILPASKAKFNWIDVNDIGKVVANVLDQFNKYKNKTIEITGEENLDFHEVVEKMNDVLNNKIKFMNVSPFKFYRLKKKEGMKKEMIIVMILLHYLPRFQKEPEINNHVIGITGRVPINLCEFIKREISKFN